VAPSFAWPMARQSSGPTVFAGRPGVSASASCARSRSWPSLAAVRPLRTARQLMAYARVVPPEASSGTKPHRGPISKSEEQSATPRPRRSGPPRLSSSAGESDTPPASGGRAVADVCHSLDTLCHINRTVKIHPLRCAPVPGDHLFRPTVTGWCASQTRSCWPPPLRHAPVPTTPFARSKTAGGHASKRFPAARRTGDISARQSGLSDGGRRVRTAGAGVRNGPGTPGCG
jgi:hypothetical protein